MGFIKKGISKATDALVGGKQIEAYQKSDQITQQETDRLNDIEGEFKSMYAAEKPMEQNSDDERIQNLFKEHLVNFMATSQKGAAPSPEELAQATAFIDSTFTKPAEQALERYGSEFQSKAQAQAAALGRNPNLDIATQQAIAGEIAKQGLGIQSDRGSRIAQSAREFSDQGFMRQGAGLQAGMSGIDANMRQSAFLNDLSQKAFANRVGLLGARSAIGDYYQRNRFANTVQGGGGHTSGALTNLGAIGNTFHETSDSIGGGKNAMTNLGIRGSNGGDAMNRYGAGQQTSGSTDAGGIAGGIAAMFSDQRLKKNIEISEKDFDEFFSSLKAYNYSYIDPTMGEGKHYSVMAQDLEKSEVGKTLVIDTPKGKMIDYTKAFAVMLAAQAEIYNKLKQLRIN